MSTKTSSGRRRIRPQPRSIWWAKGSVQLAALDAASTGSAPLSPTMLRQYDDLCSIARSMFSDGTFASINGKHFKTRPCVVHSINPHPSRRGEHIVTAYVLATYSGTPITELPELMQHFSVSVGHTEPWPSPDATVIKPSPDWPKSRKTPAYIFAHSIDIPLSAFVNPYVLEPSKDKESGRPCFLDREQMFLLESAVEERQLSYKGKSFKDLISWNDSWEVNARKQMAAARPSDVSGAPHPVPGNTAAHSVDQGGPSQDTSPLPLSQDLTSAAVLHAPPFPPSVLPSLSPPTPVVSSPVHPPPLHVPLTLQDYHIQRLQGPVPLQHSVRIQSSHGFLPILPDQTLFVPGRSDYFEQMQYASEAQFHPPQGFCPTPEQQWAHSMQLSPHHARPDPSRAFAQPQVIWPPEDATMQHSRIQSAPLSPTAAEYIPRQQLPTPHAPSQTYDPTNAQNASATYQQNAAMFGYNNQYSGDFHPSAIGMHQAEQMYLVTQANASFMPAQVMTRAREVLMRAPEMVDVAVG